MTESFQSDKINIDFARFTNSSNSETSHIHGVDQWLINQSIGSKKHPISDTRIQSL
jgi:hypothetical protein